MKTSPAGWSFLLILIMLVSGPALLRSQTLTAPGGQRLTTLEALQLAHTLFSRGDFESARKYYRDVLPSYPRSFDLFKNLGHCYFQMGPKNYSEAIRYYAQAYAINPASQEVAENLSKCYMTLKRYTEAAGILSKLARLPDAPPEIWERVAEAYDAARRIPEAEAAYDAYLQRKPGDLEARSNLGRLYSWQRSYAKAMEQFRLVLAANPNFPMALVGMARVLSWEGRFQESLDLYARVLRLEPKNGEALSGKAFTLLWLGRYEESQALFATLHKRYPSDPELARGLEHAKSALEQKDLAQAMRSGGEPAVEAYYRQRLAKDPEDLTALKALAKVTIDPMHCGEGIEFSRRAIQLSRQEPELELSLARSLASCQQYAEAITRYRRLLLSNPKAEGVLSDLGDILLRASRYNEAVETFRTLLNLNPQNSDARYGLARALALSGSYLEALRQYDQTLNSSPENYDALQGKAYVLYWTRQYAQARAIFTALAEKQPGDSQNEEMIRQIARAEEDARWAALRPSPDAPPQDFLRYYQKRLASYPDDKDAMKGLAYVQSELKNLPAAIRGYRQLVEMYPDDRDSKTELARLLSLDGQYDASINLYRNLLKTTPDDPNLQDNLARVYLWSNHDMEALEIFKGLMAKSPSNTGYTMEVARLELRLNQIPAARETLASLLAVDSRNREARLSLARLDLKAVRLESSQREFGRLLEDNPQDPDALLGKAQIAFYQGRMKEAQARAETLVKQQPSNYEGLFLLASIEHARGRRRLTLELLDQAARLSPNNPEVIQLQRILHEESAITVTTTASWARELGPAPGLGTPSLREDLRMSSYGTDVQFSRFPRTESVLSITSLPTESPPNHDALGRPLQTAISGVVVPMQFLYRQSTRLSPRFTLRAGGGLARLGPGQASLNLLEFGTATENLRPPGLVRLDVLDPNELTSVVTNFLLEGDNLKSARGHTATSAPLWLGGWRFTPTKRVSLDFDVTHSALNTTPLSVKLGVTETRLRGGVNVFFTPRAEFQANYFFANYSSMPFAHLGRAPTPGNFVIEEISDHTPFQGFSFVYNRRFQHSPSLSWNVGYKGDLYGHFGLTDQNVFLGFFNPRLYQSHLLNLRAEGKVRGPLSCDLSGGIGVQHTDVGKPYKRALVLNPGFSLKVSSHLTIHAGYTYYNTAQVLGALTGSAFRLSTEWRP